MTENTTSMNQPLEISTFTNRVTVDMAAIFSGLAVKKIANAALRENHPSFLAIQELLSLSPNTQRSSNWKAQMRSTLLPELEDGETASQFQTRARAEMARLHK